MSGLVEYFKNVNEIFWGNRFYEWWFYGAVIFLLIFQRKKEIKNVFGFYPILFIIGIFNPVSYRLMQHVSKEWQYYTRLFSMQPYPYCMMLAVILLIDKIPENGSTDILTTQKASTQSSIREVLKCVLVSGICILVFVFGNNVYNEPWMATADNIMKVPKGTKEICELLHDEGHTCMVVPSSISSYIRQVDASFYMPFGKENSNLGNEVSSEHPNPEYTMREAGKLSCDYIVIHNNLENIESFRLCGWQPYASLENYVVYEVKGVPKTRRIYNEKRELIKIYQTDENGTIEENELGFVYTCYQYDNRENPVVQYYMDYQEQPVNNIYGFCYVEKTYTTFSHQVSSIKYYDKDHNPTYVMGYFDIRYQFNGNRQVIKESYYNEFGQPMLRSDFLYASKDIKYDEDGRIIGEVYYGIDGKKIDGTFLYAELQKEYNEAGRLIRECYYDTDHKLTKSYKGYAIVEYYYDENGNIGSETYYDENEKMIEK